jgi:hypothetical protein
MMDSINIAPSTFDWHSILFCKTNTKDAFLEIKTDGTVIWKGRVVESDADFRAAMMEVHQHMCGSANGKLATARAPLAEVERLRAEVAALKARDPLAEMWRELAEYQPFADRDGHGDTWRSMCEERTSCAADTARTVARRVARAATAGIGREATREVAAACATDTAFDASWDAKRAAAWAANAIALIRQAKEVQP